MNFQRHPVRLVIILALLLSTGDLVFADTNDKQEETTPTKDGHLRTSDFPKPLREIGTAIQRAGNEVSKGINKTSQAVVEEVNKKEKNEKKEK
ncbi:MAG TPA: hypothetical protein VGJ57_12505 [Nitrospirales bacterium]|jgi:hypothetical protein